MRDTNGDDSVLNFKNSGNQNQCSGCVIAEGGQSGQPAFELRGTSPFIRGVLSHGPSTSQCNSYDTYTQLDKVRACTRGVRVCMGERRCARTCPCRARTYVCMRARPALALRKAFNKHHSGSGVRGSCAARRRRARHRAAYPHYNTRNTLFASFLAPRRSTTTLSRSTSQTPEEGRPTATRGGHLWRPELRAPHGHLSRGRPMAAEEGVRRLPELRRPLAWVHEAVHNVPRPAALPRPPAASRDAEQSVHADAGSLAGYSTIPHITNPSEPTTAPPTALERGTPAASSRPLRQRMCKPTTRLCKSLEWRGPARAHASFCRLPSVTASHISHPSPVTLATYLPSRQPPILRHSVTQPAADESTALPKRLAGECVLAVQVNQWPARSPNRPLPHPPPSTFATSHTLATNTAYTIRHTTHARHASSTLPPYFAASPDRARPPSREYAAPVRRACSRRPGLNLNEIKQRSPPALVYALESQSFLTAGSVWLHTATSHHTAALAAACSRTRFTWSSGGLRFACAALSR